MQEPLRQGTATGNGGVENALPAKPTGSPVLSQNGTSLLFFAASLLISFTFYGWLAINRLIDRDEGFYLLAAKEVLAGRSLYAEFFYPQMPLLPWVYGVVFELFGYGWVQARLFTALLAAAIAAGTTWYLHRLVGSIGALIGFVLLLCANFALPWFVVAKTYTLSTALLLAAMLLLLTLPRERASWLILVAGILAGLAVQTRLFFAPLLAVLGIWLLYQRPDYRLRNLAFFAGGAFIGSLPTLFYLSLGWDNFMFNNLGYHLGRSAHTDEVKLNQKIFIAKILFGFAPPGRDLGLHAPLLLYLFIAGTSIQLLQRQLPPLSSWVACTLFCLSLLPSPSYLQYFSVLAPFLIISIVQQWVAIDRSLRARSSMHWILRSSLLGLGLWFLSIVPAELNRFARTGEMMIGVPNDNSAQQWSIGAAERVAEALDEIARPGEQVMTLWPGYLVSSKTRVFPRFENHFGFPAALQVPRAEQRTLHLPSEWYVRDAVNNQRAEYFLTHPRLGPGYVGDLLRQAGYLVVREVEGVRIWRHTPALPKEGGTPNDNP